MPYKKNLYTFSESTYFLLFQNEVEIINLYTSQKKSIDFLKRSTYFLKIYIRSKNLHTFSKSIYFPQNLHTFSKSIYFPKTSTYCLKIHILSQIYALQKNLYTFSESIIRIVLFWQLPCISNGCCA